MDNDEERDLIPVKEKKDEMDLMRNVQAELERTIRNERRAINQLNRDELEDRYLRLHDEHLLLKKHARKQEDKIKRFATKLTRLVNDKKRLEQDGGRGAKRRDVEMEELVQDLQDKVREVEKQNSQLREKLLVVKQQVLVQTKRPNGYKHVSARIDSGRPKTTTPPRLGSPATRTTHVHPSSRISPPSILPTYAWGLVEEARNEILTLEEIINSQKIQIDAYEQELDMLKEQFKLKEFEYDEELVHLKAQLSQGQKKHVQENMDLIQLHRDVKVKSSKLGTLQVQYNDLDEKTKSLKISNDLLLKETDQLNTLLREEQNKNLDLQEELRKASSLQKTLVQLQEQINDLSAENKILKESNENLIKSALDEERYQHYETRESTLKQQISKLEATLQSDLKEKDSLLSQLAITNEKNSQLSSNSKELEEKCHQLEEKLQELESKMKIFNEGNGFDISQLEEALVLVGKKKSGNDGNKFDDDSEGKSLKAQLHQAQIDHAETVAELEKTRNMLVLQYKINKDYEAEIEAVNKRIIQVEKEYTAKLEESNHLLEMRATRIKKLERELNDIAYGTRQFKLESSKREELNAESAVNLERGQNLFEIHVGLAKFTTDGLHAMKDNHPSTFITWSFYEFELQSTPVLKGSKPHYNCTSQYIVTADDFFLHYIQWGTATFELHQAFGVEYKTVAVSQMDFKELLDQPNNRLHISLKLIGAKEGEVGVLYGIVDCWVKLHILMDQAVRFYKERCKALGYIGSNQNIVKAALKTLDSGKDQQMENRVNELHIKILCCNGLQAKSNDTQPSPYCVYKFYNLPDQDTAIIPSSNNPEFHDHKSFPLVISKELDTYLKTKTMVIYVFDDTDLDPSSYIGRTSICLVSLCENKPIQGMFDLITAKGEKAGTIDVAIYWQSAYIPPQISAEPSQVYSPKKNIAKVSSIHKSPPVPLQRSTGMSSQKSHTTSIPAKQESKEEEIHRSPKLTPIKSKPKIIPRKSLQSAPSQDSVTYNEENSVETDKSKKSDEMHQEKPSAKTPGKVKQVSFEINSESNGESGSEDVVISKLSPQASVSPISDAITILLSHLELYEGTSVIDDPNVKMLFVEYRFLDYPPEELETPFALPKPLPSQKITFDFKKVFHMDATSHMDKRQKLLNMLKSKNKEDSRIIFTIVSEPPEDCQDVDCDDIGYGFLDMKKILTSGNDFINHDIEIYDFNNSETVIGKLTVTVEAAALLKTFQGEM